MRARGGCIEKIHLCEIDLGSCLQRHLLHSESPLRSVIYIYMRAHTQGQRTYHDTVNPAVGIFYPHLFHRQPGPKQAGPPFFAPQPGEDGVSAFRLDGLTGEGVRVSRHAAPGEDDVLPQPIRWTHARSRSPIPLRKGPASSTAAAPPLSESKVPPRLAH